MAGAIVDVLEVVAVEHYEAQLAPLLLCAAKVALEPVFQATAVEQPRQRVGVRTLPLAAERDRGVERGSRVCGEKRRQLALGTVERAGEAARADEEADLLAVRTQRDQHDRAKPQAGELRHGRRAGVEQLEDGRVVDPPAHRLHCGVWQRFGASCACAPAGRLDEPALLVEQEQLARLDGKHAAERPDGHLGDRVGVAERAHVHEQPRQRGEVGARAAQLVHRRGQGPCQRCDRGVAAGGESRARLDVEHTDDARRQQERDRELRDGGTRDLDEVRVDGDVEDELGLRSADRTPDHSVTERKAVRDHRVAPDAHGPEPPVLEHEGGDAGPTKPFVKGSQHAVEQVGGSCSRDGRRHGGLTGALESAQVDRCRPGRRRGEGLHSRKIGIPRRVLEPRGSQRGARRDRSSAPAATARREQRERSRDDRESSSRARHPSVRHRRTARSRRRRRGMERTGAPPSSPPSRASRG